MSRSKYKPDTSELEKELAQGSQELSLHFVQAKKQKIKEKNSLQKVVKKDNTDTTESKKRIQERPKTIFNLTGLTQIISEVYPDKASQNILVRCSTQERKNIKSFLDREAKFVSDYPGVQLSVSKLYRFALQHMIKNHKEEFLYAMQESLSNDTI